MNILFLATNPAELEASTRYRAVQFFPALRAAGHVPRLSTFFDVPRAGKRTAATKVARVATGLARRVRTLAAADEHDVIVIHREFFPYGWNHAAPLLARRVPVVFDFDDAVFLDVDKGARALLSARASTRAIVDAASLVFAGNSYLAEYARRSQNRVEVVPTVVDTDLYAPKPRREGDVPLVGWIGSPTTARYLDAVLPILDDLAKSFRFRLRIVGAGRPIRLENVNVEAPPWRADDEHELFRDLDVGIYPLLDDDWSRGKCGFKAIQYMACGVASVVSPVGVVAEIVRAGIDGLWASTPTQWRDHLAALLESRDERARLGAAGRDRIVDGYSLHAIAPRFIAGLERVVRCAVTGS